MPCTSACTSAGSGRRPSMTTVTAVPGTGGPPNRAKNNPDGSGIPTIPASRSSKQPTSSAGPKRFFTPRTMRSVECLSPSNDSTTSTRCSSTRGPAMPPSFVTCPTSSTGSPRSLASPVSATVTARVCVTPPGAPSASAVDIVWMESTISRSGCSSSRCPRIGAEVGLGREVQLVAQRAGALGPQAHLTRRLLARDVQHPGGRLRRHLQQQRRLPHARLTGQQHDRAGDEPAAEHAVQFGHPGRPGAGGVQRDVGDAPRGRGGRARGHPRARRESRRRSRRACPTSGTTGSAPPTGPSGARRPSSGRPCGCGWSLPGAGPGSRSGWPPAPAAVTSPARWKVSTTG